MSLLTPTQLASLATSHPDWHLSSPQPTSPPHALEICYKFSDFSTAISFMVKIAFYAERLDHHPEWSNIYNRVMIRLTTHDHSGLTRLDVDLATFIDEVAHNFRATPISPPPQPLLSLIS